VDVEVAHRSARCAFGSAGPVALVLWIDITVDELHRFAEYSNGVSRRHPAYAALSITAPTLKPPPAEVRTAIVELTKQGMNTNYKGATTVLLGEGFFASVARAALAGMALVGGKMMPAHVSKSLDEGADYCAGVLQLDAAPIRAAAHEFHRRATSA
jgi:hypothetical protein